MLALLRRTSTALLESIGACRCQVIPLVNKRINQIHKDFPPQLKRISESAPPRFKAISSSVEELELQTYMFYQRDELGDGLEGADTAYLGQLMRTVEGAKRLRKFGIGALFYCESTEQVMHSIGHLGQVCELELSLWDLTGASQLSGLHS